MTDSRTRKFQLASGILAACAGLSLSAGAYAQTTFNETEPNDNKAGANVITGMAPGDIIAGNTTGTSTTVAGAASADNFNVTTSAASTGFGIYRYRLVLTTAGTAGHTGTIRGLTQTAGVPTAGSDAVVQTSSTATTPARFVQWYANNTPSRLIYRVTGGTTTTANYAATLERTAVTPIAGPSSVFPGSITITSIGQTTTDTDFWVYDSNFNPLPDFGNDDESAAGGGTGATAQSIATRTLTPGTYYVAISNYNVANNLGCPADDDFRTAAAMDYPNALANSNTTANAVVNFNIVGGDGTIFPVAATKTAAFDVAIVQFTVVPPSSPTNPVGAGSASPATVVNDGSGTTALTVNVTPGLNPSSTAHTVTITSSAIAGGTLVLSNGGSGNTFTGNATIVAGTPAGSLSLPFVVQETAPLSRSGNGAISLTIIDPPPTNDLCSGAITVLAGVPAITGNNSQATADAHNCITGTNKGVWYSFTPTATSTYQIDTNTSGFDTVLSVFDSCGGSELGCDDDGGDGTQSLLQLPLTAGQNVKILVSAFGAAGAGGAYTLNIQSILLGACCNSTSGACAVSNTGAGGCASGTVYQGDGTTCSPNPCPQPPPPANDECSSAVVLTLGTPAPGTVTNSTGADITTCSGSNIDVWYRYTPTTNGNFTVTATPTATTDSALALAVFTDCPPATDSNQPGAACVAQPGNGAVSTITFSGSAGTTYYIRAGAFVGNVNTFSIVINSITAGACCNDTTGACTTVTTGTCPTGATYQGDNSVCSPSPCPASGACCNAASGGCTTTVQSACASGSTWQGAGSTCTPNPCPQPPPPANDECTSAIALTANVAYSGSNAQATGDGTEGPGGACYTTSPTSFKQSVWFSFTAPTTNSYRVTACGTSFDTVMSVFDGTCTAFGSELGCDDDTCDGVTPPGSGLASDIASVSMTAGQTYLIRLSVWGPSASTGGAFTIQVIGDAGSANSVCCKGATCFLTTSANCTASGLAGATFVSSATTCNANVAATTPCCYANYNKAGGITVQDIFDFLNDWFAGSAFANTGGNGTGSPSVQAIFDFLNAWFAGGC